MCLGSSGTDQNDDVPLLSGNKAVQEGAHFWKKKTGQIKLSEGINYRCTIALQS